MALNKKQKPLRAVRANAGIAAAYRRKLRALVREMADSYEYFLLAQYKRDPPVLAEDATPAKDLEKQLRELGPRWRRRFDEAAPKLAAWFKQAAATRSDAALKKILRDAGMTVRFQTTQAMRDNLDAIVAENTSLIKSIQAQYATQVEGLVMRSVTAGRDLATLSRELRKRYGVSERRAALIARDQNNKATAALMRVRQTDMGIERAVWIHSGGGKEPRPTHRANNGKSFSLQTGWFDPDPKVRDYILPGQLINCRCVWRPIVKGFS